MIRKNLIRRRVRRGIQFLNARVPGWIEKIDTTRLDMDNTGNCIGGQVSGSYGRFLSEYRLTVARAVGFGLAVPAAIPPNHRFARYCTLLTDCWRKEIETIRQVHRVFSR